MSEEELEVIPEQIPAEEGEEEPVVEQAQEQPPAWTKELLNEMRSLKGQIRRNEADGTEIKRRQDAVDAHLQTLAATLSSSRPVQPEPDHFRDVDLSDPGTRALVEAVQSQKAQLSALEQRLIAEQRRASERQQAEAYTMTELQDYAEGRIDFETVKAKIMSLPLEERWKGGKQIIKEAQQEIAAKPKPKPQLSAEEKERLREEGKAPVFEERRTGSGLRARSRDQLFEAYNRGEIEPGSDDYKRVQRELAS